MVAITQQTKEEWKDKIAELERKRQVNCFYWTLSDIKELEIYKELLSQAIILPVEESWTNTSLYQTPTQLKANYPNGVIIKPK